jgi:hypothetical protein
MSKALVGGRIQTITLQQENANEEEAVFFCSCAPRERKEAGTMPFTIMGAASPWFTGEGSKI